MVAGTSEYHAAGNLRLQLQGKRIVVCMRISALCTYLYTVAGSRKKISEPITHEEIRAFVKGATNARLQHMAGNGVEWYWATCNENDCTYIPAGWIIAEKAFDYCYGVICSFVNKSCSGEVAAFLSVSEMSKVVPKQLAEMKLMLAIARKGLESQPLPLLGEVSM